MSRQARRYDQVTKAIYERPWAIHPSMLAVIEEVVRLRAGGTPLTDEEIESRISAASNGPRTGAARAQGVAVIPIYGVLSQRMSLMSAMSGGTSIEGLTRAFREALADPEVGAIVFDVDSPGGAVDGVTELASEIRAARGRKPMTAVANTAMASAAYWIGSQADEVVASPSAQVGSIGIVGMHHDISEAEAKAGIKVSLITAGEGKADGNEHEPLSDDARATLQAIADDYYALFTGDVAAARGVPAARVSGEWKAQLFTAKRAQAAGLVDRIETLDATVRRLVVDANAPSISAMAAGGLSASEQVAALLASMPIHDQLALLNDEGARVSAHYAKRAELRAKEGRSLPAQTEEQLVALEALRTSQSDDVDPDLDTDQPEEADPIEAAAPVVREPLEVLEAAVRGGYALPPREVPAQ